jgi:hypothetical protein
MGLRKRSKGQRVIKTQTSLLLLVLSAVWQAQDAQPDAVEQRKAQLQEAKEYMQGFELRLAGGNKKQLKLSESPLFVFGDPTRANENGTVWIWGEGRPAAILEVYHITGIKNRWFHAVTLTGSQTVVMKGAGFTWRPDKTQVEPKLLGDAPQPAKKDADRLRQMKEQARRFTSHEFWDPNNSRFELRLLDKPLHRYQDVAAEIQDGAAFSLANGTNPEAILLIEALGKSVETSRWHFSLARLGSAEMAAALDGKEVWHVDVAPGKSRIGRSTDPYKAFYEGAVED